MALITASAVGKSALKARFAFLELGDLLLIVATAPLEFLGKLNSDQIRSPLVGLELGRTSESFRTGAGTGKVKAEPR